MKFAWPAFVVKVACTIAACGNLETRYVKIKGSETVLPIGLKLAEECARRKDLPDVSVSAGGSGVGIAALLNGNADVAMSSRAIKLEEKIKFALKNREPMEIVPAYDALAVIVHPSNPLDTITLADLKKIYQNKVSRWSEIGGPDRPIVAFNRESSSGTYEFFKQKVLDNETFGNLESVGANGELSEKVSDNPNAIGYVGVAYVDKNRVKVLKVYNPAVGRSIAASVDASLEGLYPLARPLYFYYLKGAPPTVTRIMDYILSSEGQQAVRSTGYPPNPRYYRP
ncbi:MAG: phosphate ABC transporter substrate-binding protein [Bacteroidia bacterium]|nr:phosphate ABC transporter substrate-binding protein [Bacteroidia bacterium]